jgi:uncharacterized caspase-like protein
MAENVTRLVLRVEDEQGDREALAQLADALRRELLDLDVDAVRQMPVGDAPPDSRAFNITALGTLVITLAKSELLAAIVNAVVAWLSNRRQQTVKIEVDGDVLELTGLPSKERQRLTEEWLGRRAPDRNLSTGTRSALIIASRDYQDPGLRQLRSPAHDAEALAQVLSDPRIGGFEVHTLLDAPSYELSEAVEEFFADRSPDDLLLMHFSCHGVKDEGGELHFATSNTKIRRLAATGLAAEFVNRRMNRSRSRRIVLLLDCCYAGAFERGMTARADTSLNIEEQFGGRGRAVITASSSMEYAFEGGKLTDARELAPSVFTSALVEGLDTGEADRDQDGQVSLDELYDYVYDKVRAATPNQTPGKWTFGMQGNIYVARRARPVTTPSQLPSELQQALDHPIAGIRVGAVQELARLIHSRHAGLALAARFALQHLADDDSRAVSAAAIEALAARPKQETSPPKPPAHTPEKQPTVPAVQTPHRPAAARHPQAPQTPPHPIGAPTPPTLSTRTPAPEFSAPSAEVAGSPWRSPASSPDQHLGAASASAVLGAVLLVLSLFPTFYSGDANSLLAYPHVRWYVIILAVVVTVAGVAAYLPRTRGLTTTGVFIGAVTISTSGLVRGAWFMLGKPSFGVFRTGQWLYLVGHLAIAVAGVLAIRWLSRTPQVQVVFRWRHGLTPYLVLIPCLVNTAALGTLWLYAHRDNSEASRFWLLWTAAAALLISTYAAGASPRRFGSALLIGWAVTGAALYADFINDPSLHYDSDNSVGIYLFGATLLAMLITTVPLTVRTQRP